MRLATILNYQTGGEAPQFAEPANVEELSQVLKGWKGQACTILGEGTNSLASDQTFPGPVLSLRKMTDLSLQSANQVRMGAGVSNSALALFAKEHGLGAAAWMFRLPGQIGATVRMNARCFGGEISQIVTEVLALDAAGKSHVFRDPQMFRGYKDTIFMENGLIIAEVTTQLSPASKDEIEQKMLFCENYRIQAGHFTYPSCGCVFKNDHKLGVSSGLLLDLAACAGRRQGAAEVSRKHSNFVYNTGGAHADDILRLTLDMREAVWREFGAWLEYEMELLGTFSVDLMRQVREVRVPSLKTARLNEAKEIFRQRLQR
jgi:UDP-N-acetylmuramate dehydrogenase